MRIFIKTVFLICIFNLGLNNHAFSQISPGELYKGHSKLEGMSNCTKCHTIGAKVSNDKCLICHTEIKERIKLQKGYHVSSAVKGKECISCHNDHHGKNFQIIKFATNNFDHNLTGFKLEGAHSKKLCNDCHASKFVTNAKLKAKPHTYLGLNTECLTCHTDYHQKTLVGSCSNCHGQESFKPAVKFNHINTKFPLLGKHQSVDCSKCHAKESKDGKPFQKFAGIQFSNCTNCHTDVHDNKFGQNCKQCHSESSFHNIKNNKNFDHSKTGFLLEGRHINVACESCHKTNVTKAIKHDNCNDCHSDYHKGQFAQSGMSPDCIKCHTVNGFSPSNFTLEKHNQSPFKLQGSHIAVACFECHKKTNAWSFRNVGKSCVDCHKNIHKAVISSKYYPEENCKTCHSENSWNQLNFDHSKTNFKLAGAHLTINCRACHFPKNKFGVEEQKFAGLPKNCSNCHTDNHNKQFDKNGITDCSKCHVTKNWKESVFDHDNTAFKLDGKHANVACAKCHKLQKNEKFILYKIKNYKCEDCHTQ